MGRIVGSQQMAGRVQGVFMKTSLSSRLFVLGAIGWVGVMTGAGCSKAGASDPAACRAAEAYLPTWSKEHSGGGKSTVSKVRCEGFTPNAAADSAETSIRFEEDISGIGTFQRRGTVHFKKSAGGDWQVTLANIS